MSEVENVRVVEKWIAAHNAHDVSELGKYRAPGYRFEFPSFTEPVGGDAEDATLQGLFEAFSDLHLKVERIIAQGDYVVVNGVTGGTNDGPLTYPDGRTIPATGKKVMQPVSHTYQFQNGKVVRLSGYMDRLGMGVQLGLMESM